MKHIDQIHSGYDSHHTSFESAGRQISCTFWVFFLGKNSGYVPIFTDYMI